MQTSYFKNYTGEGRIVIARWAPRGTPKGFKYYSPLKPATKEMLHMGIEEYQPLYFAQLEKLNPQQVWEELHQLAYPNEPILLCWEQPPFTRANFCHRRMVAEWLEKELGQNIPELGQPGSLF